MSRSTYIIVWLIGLLFNSNIVAFSQSNTCIEPSEKAVKLYDKAVDLWNSDNNKAKKYFYEALDIEPQWVAPYFFMAKNYFNQSEIIQYDTRKVASLERLLNQSSDFFEKVIENCPAYQNYEAYYYLGKIYFTGGNLAEAHRYLGKYIQQVNADTYLPLTQVMYQRTESYKHLIDNPVAFNPKPVDGICTSNDEFMPLLTPDGSRMYFTRKSWQKPEGSYSAQLVEEFCKSDLLRFDSIGNPVFDEPRAMEYPFNQDVNQGAATVTIDNNRMYLTVCEQIEMPDGRPYKNCDIYETRILYGSWTAFERLSNGINGLTTWEGHPTISSDGNRLYFASYRPGGIGGIDLYESQKDSVGNWGKPQNMGIPINSELNERAPFLHPDGKTLYFASDGHGGVGGYDIFVSRFIDSAWQTPQNIGYPINTTGDESGFIVNTYGTYAYLSSNVLQGPGGYDIFSFELHDNIKPGEMMFFKGKLVDGDGMALRDASVEIRNVQTMKVQKGIVDDETGKYAVALPAQMNDYIVTVKKPNHVFTTRHISISDSTKKQLNIEFDFIVPEARAGVGARIPDILFDYNSAEFSEISLYILDEFVAYMRENLNIKVRIEGHTDNIATDSYNLRLSEKRAARVYKHLVKEGISKRRLSYKGYGASKPIADNSTEQGRRENRRIEFVIVEE